MEKKISSPWLAVSVGIIGLILGYGFVLSEQGPEVFARRYRCEAHKNMCTDGMCTKSCPHNCIDPSA